VGNAPVLVLSPHPDDAVLGCWSALQAGEAQPAVVVNVFAGIPPVGTRGGWDMECGVPDGAEMMRRRRAEEDRALAVAGASAVNLDFLDMQYVDEPRDAHRIAAAVRLATSAGWSALYAPAGVGGFTPVLGTKGLKLAPHPDHETVREVALNLEQRDVPTYFYGELVYGLGERRGMRWPGVLGDFTPVLEAATGRSLELVLNELPHASLAGRMRALSCYGTQLSRLELGVGPFLRDPAVVRYEVFWRARGPGRSRDRHWLRRRH
jgi:LmbE family N-acetylglucosaminyl deacetylase